MYAAVMGEIWNAYRILVGKLGEKYPFEGRKEIGG
jgi:hypothetical protein